MINVPKPWNEKEIPTKRKKNPPKDNETNFKLEFIHDARGMLCHCVLEVVNGSNELLKMTPLGPAMTEKRRTETSLCLHVRWGCLLLCAQQASLRDSVYMWKGWGSMERIPAGASHCGGLEAKHRGSRQVSFLQHVFCYLILVLFCM